MSSQLGIAHAGARLADDGRGHAVIDCSSCGFAHFWPKPTPEELATYYAQSFYETHSPSDWFDKEASEESYWQIEHADRLNGFTELLEQRVGKLLDIGCGAGWLLAYAAERGWEVLGIEPSRTAWELASRRANVRLGTFPEVDVSDGAPFDAVHLKLVMEHVPDPAVILDAVRNVLRPGGVVCVEVPNDFNRLQAAARQQLAKPAWWVVYPVHINYFNFASLERLLARCGFEPVRRVATYPMEWFLLQGVDYIGRDDVGRRCHEQRMTYEMNLESAGMGEFRRAFSRWLADHGIGREAVVYARRRGRT